MKKNAALMTILLTGLLGMSAGMVGCSVAQGQQSVGSYVDDATITASVKKKLLEDPVVSGLAVDVDTNDGVVQLSGFAKTQTEKDRAEAIARGTKGVKSVKNSLTIRSSR